MHWTRVDKSYGFHCQQNVAKFYQREQWSRVIEEKCMMGEVTVIINKVSSLVAMLILYVSNN